MKECWSEKNTRKQPQAIARDMNQIMYATYNRCRPYATPYLKVLLDDDDDDDENNDLEEKILNNESYESSLVFDHTNLTHDDNNGKEADGSSHLICKDCGDKMIYLKDNKIQCCTKKKCKACLGLMEDISQNKCWFVHKNCVIGSGFYGKVFIGTRIHVRSKNIQQIAIKIPNIIPSKDENDKNPYKCFVKDFKREFNIMKVNHINALRIKCRFSKRVCIMQNSLS